jgi:peptidoglycan/LPS O-acetylase OafA/YrhL
MLPTRIPELDGVRGVAVLLVVVYHAFLFSAYSQTGWIATLASYGFAGVDLFFVLSGFLITGILLKAKGGPGYFRAFYARRALRIWPLYYLLLVFSFGLLPLLVRITHLPMGEFAKLEGRNKFVYVALLQNLWYPGPAGPTMLAMTWSLAIEEQFYLVWPWLVLLCNRRTLVWVLGAVLLLSPVARLWARWLGMSTTTMYFLTWFRLDGLALGALLALWFSSERSSLERTKWAALTALAVAVPGSLWLLGGHAKAFWPLQYSMLAVASAGLVTFAIWCRQTVSIYGRPLRMGWLRYMGQVSYCLYLVHAPVYYALGGRLAANYARRGPGVAALFMLLGFVVSLGIASLSWFLLESRIARVRQRLSYGRRSEALYPAEAH